MARKLDTIKESLEFLQQADWNYANTFEVYDRMLQTISDAVRSATCEMLTRASIPTLGGSWSVVMESNRDPEVFRELCVNALLLLESRAGVKPPWAVPETVLGQKATYKRVAEIKSSLTRVTIRGDKRYRTTR